MNLRPFLTGRAEKVEIQKSRVGMTLLRIKAMRSINLPDGGQTRGEQQRSSCCCRRRSKVSITQDMTDRSVVTNAVTPTLLHASTSEHRGIRLQGLYNVRAGAGIGSKGERRSRIAAFKPRRKSLQKLMLQPECPRISCGMIMPGGKQCGTLWQVPGDFRRREPEISSPSFSWRGKKRPLIEIQRPVQRTCSVALNQPATIAPCVPANPRAPCPAG